MGAKRAVVTAGTGGIGLETAVGLAEAGFAVTVVGRDAGRGAAAVERIDAAGRAAGGGAVPARFLRVDLSSLAEVRGLAGVLGAEGRLDVLVNNVGGFFVERREFGGVEASFVLNHLSPYLLTELLLPALTASAPSRVVAVSSAAVALGGRRFDSAEPGGSYYGFHRYGRAKLANLAYSLDLAKRLEGTGVAVLAADPGGASTDLSTRTMTDPRIVSPALRVLWPVLGRVFARSTSGSARDAARSSLVAATDPGLAGRTGIVIGADGRVARPARAATSPAVAASVRQLSERLVAERRD
ncbi:MULTISPECIES: SDR family NAD(P)-dependent oxidoreductase [Actinosynnema]|uniref:SDR family NAD(P)-dependent oxidoreductase n=1 Tax=Actinosynnema TaxID=40566 RepID=UPI0020A5706A|nr:SDR family NAD(P)-dependent oxidoreductase [Actinosynnema pretiosum]MCP2099184.1 Short-chain dehydrogenase [Actinosynnema pretiosum]